jgi:hypothetical protein
MCNTLCIPKEIGPAQSTQDKCAALAVIQKRKCATPGVSPKDIGVQVAQNTINKCASLAGLQKENMQHLVYVHIPKEISVRSSEYSQ